MVSRRFLRGIPVLFGFMLFAGTPMATADVPGLTLGWLQPRDQSGWTNVMDLDCQGPSPSHLLFATFIPTADIPDFIGMEATVDLGYFVPPNGSTPPLAPFWHFESGGCNEGGLMVDYRMPAGTGLPNPWTGVQSIQVGYSPDYTRPGLGRLRISIYRSTPTTLLAGTNYFAFRSDLLTCLGGICDGCDEDLGVHFDQAGLVGFSQSDLLAGNDDRSFVCINSCVTFSPLFAPAANETGTKSPFFALSNVTQACEPTPVRKRTWGETKVVYR